MVNDSVFLPKFQDLVSFAILIFQLLSLLNYYACGGVGINYQTHTHTCARTHNFMFTQHYSSAHVQSLKPSVSQPPGRGPVPGPDINYTGPRDVLLEFIILIF